MILFIKLTSSLLFLTLITSTQANKWSGKGRLYDERNQYFVTCRLVKEKRVKPFLGEDTVKCHYRCQDYKDIKDEFVVTTHSDYACEKQVTQPRGKKRDWRSK
tara:strand:- start:242 stop:550 length:309 start_codon:yes stop_codon:yes gene_type:complete